MYIILLALKRLPIDSKILELIRYLINAMKVTFRMCIGGGVILMNQRLITMLSLRVIYYQNINIRVTHCTYALTDYVFRRFASLISDYYLN